MRIHAGNITFLEREAQFLKKLLNFFMKRYKVLFERADNSIVKKSVL